MTKSAIIIGASRGLGLGLTHELLGRGWDVVATRRGPAAELEASGAEVAVVDMDVRADVERLAASLGARRFDVVLLCAGTMGPDHAFAERTADGVDKAAVADLMWTNAVAPVRAGRVLLPLVEDGGTMAFMSSILGSVSLRHTGFAELYSASKSALNSLVTSFANVDAKGRVATLALHPGWVRTEMGTEHADLDVDTSVRGMADVLGAPQPPACRYVTYAGDSLPW